MDITKVVLSELKEIKLRLQHKIKKMKFEFLHELIGAKTEDISNDEDAIC